MRFTIQKKLFYSHFLAVVLVSGSIGTFFYHSATTTLFKQLQNRLMNSAALISQALDAHEIEDIREPGDVSLASYQKNLNLLRDFKAANQDIAFIYIMRRQGDDIAFVIDSDQTDQQAQPGKVYEIDVPNMKLGFTAFAADNHITCDEWGCFLSGYAPLKNGNGRYLLGIDMRADEVAQKFRAIRIAGIVSLMMSVLLAFVFSRFLAARITRPINIFVRKSSDIANGIFPEEIKVDTRDELSDLAQAFNTMSGRLKKSHENTQQAMADLKDARDTLETRVVERTARLAELNEKLRQEIEERKRAEIALETAATTDYLTGALNRRAMITLLEEEFKRVIRSNACSSIILIDLDHFKSVNDRFGHETGDKLLVFVTQTLRGMLREQDAIARWGGEEILILLPKTGQKGAREVAEKIRLHFAQTPAGIDGQTIPMTASLGVCQMEIGMSIDECFRRADKALYQAKEQGRNKTVVAE
jgi:diguanylate cyclase (GGDEF)-like protein